MITLLRRGVLDEEDLVQAAASVSGMGGDADEAAHLVNCAIMRASLPAPSQLAADHARARFRVISSDDGGNSEG